MTLSPNFETALRLADLGYFVFPCRSSGDGAKKPMPTIQWRKMSSNDPQQVSRWWRTWPYAAPGLDLAKSGLIVIDADRHGQADGVLAVGDMMADHGYDPAPVPTVSTPGNGTHFFYRQPEGKSFGNADSRLYKGCKLKDMGINIRGDGGYVIAPGSEMQRGRYELFGDLAAAPVLPDWFSAILDGEPARPVQPMAVPRTEMSDQRIRAYCDAAIAAEVAKVAGAAEGGRNNTLNEAAFALGQLVGAGFIGESEVFALLANAAAHSGLDAVESRMTIQSGLGAGRKEPRVLPQSDLPHAVDPLEAARINAMILAAWEKKEAERNETEKARAKSELEWFDHVQPVTVSPYIIKGFLDHAAMSVIYGPSNSGKTFFALDLAFHIATAARWRERRVDGGAVLYLAAEGGNGIANRIAALRSRTGVTDVPLALRRAGLDLLDPRADTAHVIRLAREVEEVAPLSLIVIDTLSRVIAGGDENAATDMTAFIRNVDAIRQATGAHVMIVHHTGKDVAKGARGHSSLRAATDTEIEVSVDEVEGRVARVTKQRDYEGGEEFRFKLKAVDLGHDQDGDRIGSCVVTAAEGERHDDLPSKNTCKVILREIQTAFDKGNPYSMTIQSQRTGRYAPRALSRHFNVKTSVMDRLLKAWLDNEIIISSTFDSSNNRSGLKVIGDLV